MEENSSGIGEVAATLPGPRYAWLKCWTQHPWYSSHVLSWRTLFTISYWLPENTSRT